MCTYVRTMTFSPMYLCIVITSEYFWGFTAKVGVSIRALITRDETHCVTYVPIHTWRDVQMYVGAHVRYIPIYLWKNQRWTNKRYLYEVVLLILKCNNIHCTSVLRNFFFTSVNYFLLDAFFLFFLLEGNCACSFTIVSPSRYRHRNSDLYTMYPATCSRRPQVTIEIRIVRKNSIIFAVSYLRIVCIHALIGISYILTRTKIPKKYDPWFDIATVGVALAACVRTSSTYRMFGYYT